jgi:excisionase family DNA binding protein
MPSLEHVIDAVADAVAARVTAKGSDEPYLSAEQAAEYLACTPKRIYELVAADRLRHYRDGRRLLFRRDDLDAALEVCEPRAYGRSTTQTPRRRRNAPGPAPGGTPDAPSA